MLRAHLYHINRHELKPLGREELLQTAPTPEETARKKQCDNAGSLSGNNTHCREGEFVWVDAVDPDEDDFKILAERFNLHPMVLDDLREH